MYRCKLVAFESTTIGLSCIENKYLCIHFQTRVNNCWHPSVSEDEDQAGRVQYDGSLKKYSNSTCERRALKCHSSVFSLLHTYPTNSCSYSTSCYKSKSCCWKCVLWAIASPTYRKHTQHEWLMLVMRERSVIKTTSEQWGITRNGNL